jgi:hypothetical protein
MCTGEYTVSNGRPCALQVPLNRTHRHYPRLAHTFDLPNRVLKLGLGEKGVRPDVIVVEQVAEVLGLVESVGA